MSGRVRQLNRDVAETPLWSDNKVVKVASSMVTTPPIRSGPCSVTGSTSKTVSPAAQVAGVPGVGFGGGTGMSRRRISRAFSKA